MTASVLRPVAPPQKSKKEDRPVIDAERAKRLYTTRAVHADPFSESLTDAQIRQFREQGWVAIEGVFSAEEVDAAKAALSDLIHGRIALKEGLNYVQEEPAPLLADGTPAPETPEERELRVRKVFVTHNFTHHHPRIEAMTMQSRGEEHRWDAGTAPALS
jgi:hypothetical protein